MISMGLIINLRLDKKWVKRDTKVEQHYFNSSWLHIFLVLGKILNAIIA